MKRADVKKFLDRDWDRVREAKDAFISARMNRSSRARKQLPASVQTQPPVSARLARMMRREDFETHVRVKAVLDRIGKQRPR